MSSSGERRFKRSFFQLEEGRAGRTGFLGNARRSLGEGESFAQARELEEETGIRPDSIGPEVARREFVLWLESGESVMADERYFVVVAPDQSVSRAGWTALEKEVMVEHRWWSLDELAGTAETVWPEDLIAMIRVVSKG